MRDRGTARRNIETDARAPEIHDEPGMAERFQRGLRNLIKHTPPKPRKPSAPKSQGAVRVEGGAFHKGKGRN